MAGSFRIEAYSALYSVLNNRSGNKGDRVGSSFSSGVFMSGNSISGASSKGDVFSGIAQGIKEDKERREMEELQRIQNQLRQMKREQQIQ